jgi:Protein of unknown function (DUF3016)
MKTPRIIPTLLTLVAGALGSNADLLAAAEKSESRIEVVFFEREKFTDARDSHLGSDKGRDDILQQLKTHLQERAKSYLQPGESLQVTIKDVDLAGDFEPWRTGGGLGDVRIVKEIYPPRVTLAFRLVDASGEVVKQGTRDLRDLMFQRTAAGMYFDHPLRYEKSMLDDWLRSEFSRVKRAS